MLLGACDDSDRGEWAVPSFPRVSEQEAAEILAGLLGHEPDPISTATARAAQSGDLRFAAPLIELLWASEVKVIPSGGHNARVVALEALTGQHLGASWFAWLEWLEGARLPVLPGYAAYKARLLGRLYPRFEEILGNERVDPAWLVEIHWSGSPPGGVPALVDPQVIEAAAAGYLDPGEPVVGLVVDGLARAYPLRILDWHEVANDVIGGVAVAVVSCPLCGSASAWRTRGPDGERHLYEASSLILWGTSLLLDPAAGSLWSPIHPQRVSRRTQGDPEPVAIPVVITRWQDWRAQHPDTTVLSLETGYERPYVPGQPYAEYYLTDGPRFPVPPDSDDLPAKQRVYGIRAGGVSSAFSLERISEEQVLNDQVGDVAVVLVATRGQLKARYGDPDKGREYGVGAEVRAFARGEQRFVSTESASHVEDKAGNRWEIREGALVGPEGRSAPRLTGTLAYWFAWRAFSPGTDVR